MPYFSNFIVSDTLGLSVNSNDSMIVTFILTVNSCSLEVLQNIWLILLVFNHFMRVLLSILFNSLLVYLMKFQKLLKKQLNKLGSKTDPRGGCSQQGVL